MERKMNSLKNKTPFRLPLRVYLSYLLVLTLIFTAVSFAKFATSGGGGDGARVASFAVNALGADERDLSIVFTEVTGTKIAEYAIDVYNYKDSKVSEVAVGYDVIVTVTGGLPDGVTMTLDGKSPTASGGVYTFSNVGAFAASVMSDDEHILTFTADSSKIYTDLTGADKLSVDIDVRFEQID